MSEQKHDEQELVSMKKLFETFLKEFYIPDVAVFIDELEDPLYGKDLKHMVEMTGKLREKIEKQRDNLSAESKLDMKQVDNFMSNQDNFSRREWNALDNFKNSLEEYKKEFQIAAQGAGIREIIKEGRKRSQRKKSKLERFDSNSKKNWIPM